MRRLTHRTRTADHRPLVWRSRPASGSRRMKAVGMGAMLMLVVIGLTGCLSIKSQGLTQTRVPGLVTLGGVVCGSDYNRTTYAGCDGDGSDGTGPANVAERDNRAHSGCDADGSQTDANAGCPGLSGDGQLMVGFRVPIGSDGPPTFSTDARDLTFEKSPTYT